MERCRVGEIGGEGADLARKALRAPAQAEHLVARGGQLEAEGGAEIAAAGDENPQSVARSSSEMRSSAKRAACSQQPFMLTPKYD